GLLGRQHDGRAVGVGGADEMHGVAGHAPGTYPDVGLDVADQVAQMQVAVAIRQGGGDEQCAGHAGKACWSRALSHAGRALPMLPGATAPRLESAQPCAGRIGAPLGERTMDTYQDQVKAVLATLTDPHTGVNLVESGSFRGAARGGDGAMLDLVLGYPGRSWHGELRVQVQEALAAAGLGAATVSIEQRVVPHAVREGLAPLPEVKNIIGVASGKGGVGKSTPAANLALALAAEGAAVGVLDADIYGPSVPRMLGVSGRPQSPDGRHFQPMLGHGLQCMSIGFMVDEDTAMIWRGPMVSQALQQLVGQTAWSGLDYL